MRKRLRNHFGHGTKCSVLVLQLRPRGRFSLWERETNRSLVDQNETEYIENLLREKEAIKLTI